MYDSYDYDIDGIINKNDLKETYHMLFKPKILNETVNEIVDSILEDNDELNYDDFISVYYFI